MRHVWARGREHSRRPRVREFGIFAASTFVYQGARFLFSLSAARSLVSADFSLWAVVVALLVYAPSLLLGTANGMSRELPILIGQTDMTAARRSMTATWTVTVAVAALTIAVALGCAWAVPELSLSALCVGVLVSETIVFGTQQFLLRSRLQFNAASAQLASVAAVAIVGAGLLWVEGESTFELVAAAYAGALLAGLIAGAVLGGYGQLRFDLDETRRLARIGFPIMLAGLIFSLFVTVDRWMAITLLGPQRAAPYALASLIAAAMLVVPTVVSQQMYPRMALSRGSGESSEFLRGMANKQGVLAAMLITPVAVLIAVFALLAVPAFLPEYATAAPAVIALSPGFVALGYLTGYGNYLNVVGAQWRYLAAQSVGVCLALLFTFLGGTVIGLLGIALGMTGSHFVYGWVLRAVATRTDIRQA